MTENKIKAEFTKWPKIGKFSDATYNYRRMKGSGSKLPDKLTYKAKVKLHGTNAAIHYKPDGEHRAQSRKRLLSIGSDNALFAFWLASVPDFFAPDLWVEGMIVYGEWCGPGVQSIVASCSAPHKFFAVFAIREIDGSLTTNPDVLRQMFRERDDLVIIPWLEGSEVEVDFFEGSDEHSDLFDQLVDQVEAEDPFIKETFDVSGIGEGVVYYPTGVPFMSAWGDLAFKCKGEKHAKGGKKSKNKQNPVKLTGALSFADEFVTPERLQQGIAELGLEERPSDRTGDFVRWVLDDVLTECVNDLKANDLEPKDVQKVIGKYASGFYLGRL